MKIIRGFKIGGLQQKIFNLMLIFILALIGAYAAVSVWQQRNLAGVVEESSARQQESIARVSEETMEAVLSTSMTQSTALQAYIADDLFGDVRTDVLTLQAFATELFEQADSFTAHPVQPPLKANDGKASAMVIHAPGAETTDSELLGLVGNMSEIMVSMFDASDKLSGCFVGTADGHLLFVNDRAASYVSEDGIPMTLDVTSRPWYTQAAQDGKLVFTGVELDAYTGISTLECAAPVYRDGELVAVVAADIFLTSISDYVNQSTASGGFLCVVNEGGEVLFSPEKTGPFRVERSGREQDLRESDNRELAQFVTHALSENTGLIQIAVDGKDYYMVGVPMSSVGWAVLSIVDKEITHQPTAAMLARYDEINAGALATYEQGAVRSARTILVLTIVILLLALVGAFVVATRIVKPLEKMTKRINALQDGDIAFEMDDAYRTDDEIEILAESFATLSKRTREYITQVAQITAEKERVGTELAMAANIQTHMLPNTFPAYPSRKEFDIFATMDPAKEVGGDFYDFFMVGEDHLAMVVADVSGKGVPAALFSMIAKTMLKTQAQTRLSPERVLEEVNAALGENNDEDMFVTVWLGVLEISTGELTYADAGHEKLCVYQDGTWKMLPKAGGVALAVWDPEDLQYMDEKYRFRNQTLQLQPGDVIFQYTDGVTEATDASNALFGEERLMAALNSSHGTDLVPLLHHVRMEIDTFVKDAPQFDDITMLALRYIGDTGETTEGGIKE